MQNEYAWSEVGTRAHVCKNKRKGKSYSLLADLSLHGMQAPFIVDGSVNANDFLFYAQEILLPTLRSGQIVVMDNCTAHSKSLLTELFETNDIQIWFLPAYSPDLSPIELAFNQIKQLLKKASAQSFSSLSNAIKEAIDSITLSDILAWFRLCGYSPQ